MSEPKGAALSGLTSEERSDERGGKAAHGKGASRGWLTDEQQRIWRSYLRVESLLPARLNRELQADSGLSLAEYAVLVPLSESSEGRMRPFELGNTLNWEQSRLSHQLMRMENRGLISREACPSDRRGALVVLTEAGRQTIEAAAPGHVNAVRTLFFDQLTVEQATVLGEACAAIASVLELEQPSPPCD